MLLSTHAHSTLAGLELIKPLPTAGSSPCRLPVCRGTSGSATRENSPCPRLCHTNNPCVPTAGQSSCCLPSPAAVLTECAAPDHAQRSPPPSTSCEIRSGQCMKSFPPSSPCRTCLNTAERGNAWGHVWDRALQDGRLSPCC